MFIGSVGSVNVMIGLDGMGGGTFLWDRSTGPHSFVGRLEIAGLKFRDLPSGFFLFPQLRIVGNQTASLNLAGPSVIAQGKSALANEMFREMEDCVKAGVEAGSPGASDGAATRFAEFIPRRVASKFLIEGIKSGARARIASGSISTAGRIGRVVRWGATRPIFGPLFVASTFLQMSYHMSPTEEEAQAMDSYHRIRAACAEAIQGRYGASFHWAISNR